MQNFLQRVRPTSWASHTPNQPFSWLEQPDALREASIMELVSKGRDVYFAPVNFRGPRRAENAKKVSWVWADLDFVHPEKLKLRPTIAWQSSPGRYQALWELSEHVPAAAAAECGKRMAYAEGADKGGWTLPTSSASPALETLNTPAPPPWNCCGMKKRGRDTQSTISILRTPRSSPKTWGRT